MEPNNIRNRNSNVTSRPMRAPGFATGAPSRVGAPAGRPMPNVSPASANAPMDAGDDVVFQDKPKKKSHAMLYGMIFLAILAAAGIGFGVWAFLDGNARVAKKDEQIADLNGQVSSLQQEKSDLTDQVAELTKSNEEAQADIAKDEEIIKEDEAQIAEDQQQEATGYQVMSIGACVLDSGTAEGSSTTLKCDAVTSLGNGKFVYDSQSGKLRFITLQ